MASDKRPNLQGKRTRNRRKRAAFRNSNRVSASITPNSDIDGDKQQPQQVLVESCSDLSSYDKIMSQSDTEDELDSGLVIVCCQTLPDFCSVFQPRHEMQSRLVGSKVFTVHIPTFQETCEGYITYTLKIMTCGHTFQVERRFSEFVACAAEINKHFATEVVVHSCAQRTDEKTAIVVANAYTWELPAKTWFRVSQTQDLEERRARLELSLETLLLQKNREICNLPLLRDFLMLDVFGVQVTQQNNHEIAAHFE
ncbi:hypothetical protein CCR75_009710 [Bremia lactucae]|uniref:PX domain-containing protein n=1 Tax=Bremia lactucae TaxID=4779 RepID=A0A976FPH5_BRELC|nr:hypothetical protein CCR75_009710 [Bremia lactucae]